MGTAIVVCRHQLTAAKAHTLSTFDLHSQSKPSCVINHFKLYPKGGQRCTNNRHVLT